MPGLKPATAERYLCSLKMARPTLDHLFLDEIGRKELAAIAGRQGPSIATRRRDLDAVAVVLYAAEAWGWLDTAPDFKRIRRGLKERRAPIRPPSDEEIAAVLAVAPERFGQMVRFARLTGMRQEEAASLERRSVDFQKGEAQLWETKTSRPRRVALRTIVGDALAIVDAIPPKLGCSWLFWHHDGARFANVASRFSALCRRAGVRFRFHDLRHRFAYDWLTSGGDIYALSKHLGHANVKVTDQIYGGWCRQGPEHAPEQQSEVG
ncbi:MAG: tyrosine-type recombinase/integrase [Hyphomicrobiaceae bacterium]